MTMAHLMSNKLPCGLPDSHTGQHRSSGSLEQRRTQHMRYNRRYRRTLAGILAGVRANAKRRELYPVRDVTFRFV